MRFLDGKAFLDVFSIEILEAHIERWKRKTWRNQREIKFGIIKWKFSIESEKKDDENIGEMKGERKEGWGSSKENLKNYVNIFKFWKLFSTKKKKQFFDLFPASFYIS